MTASHGYQHTVRELMAARGIPSINQLAKRAGIANSTAKRAADGGIFANNESAADAIARALGVKTNEIRWSKTPSTRGKEVGAGQAAKSAAKAKVCPRCHTAVPSGTGICEDDGIRGV